MLEYVFHITLLGTEFLIMRYYFLQMSEKPYIWLSCWFGNFE